MSYLQPLVLLAAPVLLEDPAATDAASSDASLYHSLQRVYSANCAHAQAACINSWHDMATRMVMTCCTCVGLQPFTVFGWNVSLWLLACSHTICDVKPYSGSAAAAAAA